MPNSQFESIPFDNGDTTVDYLRCPKCLKLYPAGEGLKEHGFIEHKDPEPERVVCLTCGNEVTGEAVVINGRVRHKGCVPNEPVEGFNAIKERFPCLPDNIVENIAKTDRSGYLEQEYCAILEYQNGDIYILGRENEHAIESWAEEIIENHGEPEECLAFAHGIETELELNFSARMIEPDTSSDTEEESENA